MSETGNGKMGVCGFVGLIRELSFRVSLSMHIQMRAQSLTLCQQNGMSCDERCSVPFFYVERGAPTCAKQMFKNSRIQEKQTDGTNRAERGEWTSARTDQPHKQHTTNGTAKKSRRTAHETRTTPRTAARTSREQKLPNPQHRTTADEAQHTTPVTLYTEVGTRWGCLVVHVAVGPGGGVSSFSSLPRSNNVEKWKNFAPQAKMDLANCKKAVELMYRPFSSVAGTQAAPVSNTSAAVTSPAGGLPTGTLTQTRLPPPAGHAHADPTGTLPTLTLYVAHQTAPTITHTQAETEEQFPETKIPDMTEPGGKVGFDFQEQIFMGLGAA